MFESCMLCMNFFSVEVCLSVAEELGVVTSRQDTSVCSEELGVVTSLGISEVY